MTSPLHRPAIRVLLALALCAPSVIWIALNRSLWPWDPAWYGEVSVDLWYRLTCDTATWPWAMVRAFASKAPLVAWIGQFFVPLGRALGSVDFALLLSIVLTQAGTLLLIFAAAVRLAPRNLFAPLAAVAFTASAPLFIGLNHQYFVEPLQTFGVAWLFWVAVSAPTLSRVRAITHLVAASALLMGAKASSPLYAVFPGVVALLAVLRGRSGRPRVRSWTAEIARIVPVLVFTALVVTWYAINFRHVADHVAFSASAEDYGKFGPFFDKLRFWLTVAWQNFIYPPLAWPAAIVGLGAVVGKAFSRQRRVGALTAGAGMLTFAVALCVFSRSANEEPRYLLPLLPGLAVALAWLLDLSWPRLAKALAVAVAVIGVAQLALVQAQAFGLVERHPNLAIWVHAVERDAGAYTELDRLVEAASPADRAYRYVICGVEVPALNANTLSYHAAKQSLDRGFRCYFTSLGYAAADPQPAWDRMTDLNASYFITLAGSGTSPANFLNRINEAIRERVRGSPVFVQVPFDSPRGIELYRREAAPPASP